MYKVTLRLLLATIIAVEKEYVLNITSVCTIASVFQREKRMRRIILRYVALWLYHILPHYLINGKIFEKKKNAFEDFPYKFYLKYFSF